MAEKYDRMVIIYKLLFVCSHLYELIEVLDNV